MVLEIFSSLRMSAMRYHRSKKANITIVLPVTRR